jgi:hypothetical protein
LTPAGCGGIVAAVKMKSDSIFISMAQVTGAPEPRRGVLAEGMPGGGH